jgi:hypothetical protein
MTDEKNTFSADLVYKSNKSLSAISKKNIVLKYSHTSLDATKMT